MKEIRIHGRGGQGAVTASQVLALAAFFDGKFGQGFPMFGVERRGAPVQAFARISDKKINDRSQVYKPDFVIVLEPSLLQSVNVIKGLEKGKVIIINSDKKPNEFNLPKEIKVECVDITGLAIKTIGKPFVNVASLGAFAKLTQEISFKALEKAIKQVLEEKGEKIINANLLITKAVYDSCLGGSCKLEGTRE